MGPRPWRPLRAGQKRGGPPAAAAGHLGMDRQLRWLGDWRVGAHPQSATGHPGWDSSSGDGVTDRTPSPRPLKLPASPILETRPYSKDPGKFHYVAFPGLRFFRGSQAGCPSKTTPDRMFTMASTPAYSVSTYTLPIPSPSTQWTAHDLTAAQMRAAGLKEATRS